MCLDQSCEDGAVRLVDGHAPFQGRVEICVASTWSGVCDAQWDLNTTKVLCQQLNFSTSGTHVHQTTPSEFNRVVVVVPLSLIAFLLTHNSTTTQNVLRSVFSAKVNEKKLLLYKEKGKAIS